MSTQHWTPVGVLDPKVKIVVGGTASGWIHAWSVDATSQDTATVVPKGEILHIHGRDATLQPLRALG